MVNFMCFPETDKISVFGVFKPFKALMDQYIVNQKITYSISGNATCYKKQIIETALDSKVKKNDAWNGENDKKDIITLKSMFVFWLVMICVEIPHQPMHNVLVRKPGNAFHEQKNP